MSGEKTSSPCNKFQANVFNKSKCQNCFKSRELHLLRDRDQEQAKPVYGGWLCLAPEGTDFDNPMQRSRKWQRRFFILYERGSLSFALDELPSTLPQGTVNLNLCTDIGDAEPRTGQRNALCIATSQQEIFIRGDNKEIINGWSEQLAAYLRTNKQVQKKKRKVEPVATAQEPSPAKMAATDPAESGRGRWQEEEQRGGGPDVTEQSPAGNSPAPDGADGFGKPPLDAAPSRDIHQPANDENENQDGSRRSAAERILGSEQGPVSIRGRTEARSSRREKLQSCSDSAQLGAPAPQRRARSLDRRTSDTVMTPDLLNFKKGWMMKLDESDQWKKYWFVLSTDRLRFYKDSMTEEASDLEGELDLTRCYNVSEFLVQRNYGFQIHTPKSVYTLSAMTAGIRKNWIQSLMKNVHPAHAPDVTSLSRGPLELLPRPDVTQDSHSTHVPAERDPHPKPRSVTEKRREGRYRTFDWAEFRPQSGPAPPPPPEAAGPRAGPPCPLELGDLDRRRRREERRRRYEDTLGFSLSWRETGAETEDGSGGALSPRSQRRVEEEIEEMWRQVETTVFRPDGTVPLFTADKDTEEVEKLLDGYRDGAEDLKLRLAESERRRRELEAQLSAAGRLHHHHHRQVTSPEPAPGSEAHLRPSDTNHEPSDGRALSLTEVHEETREPSQQRDVIQDEPPSSTAQPAPSIWLHDTEGNLQEVGHFLSDGVATPLLSADGRRVPSQSDGDIGGLNYDGSLQRQLDGEDGRLFPSSQTQTDEYSAAPLIVEKPDDQAMVRRLSQEVELLTGQNEALNQRNQEMLNQLTEADREIERLKAELSSRYTDAHHLPEVEQQGSVGPEEEDLEKELSARTQELAEAQALIASLKENLRETEELRRDVPAEKEATGEEKSDQRAEAYLLRCFEATEAKLTQLERQLDQSESNRRELQAQNAELREAEERYRQRAAEAEADILRLSGEEEEEEEAFHEDKRRVSGEERIGQVIEGMVVRLEALGAFLEAIDRLDFGKRSECEEETTPDVVRQLKWEEEFWRFLLGELRAGASQSDEEKSVAVLLRDVTEHMIVEREMLLLGLALLSETDEGEGSEGLTAPDAIWNSASVTATGTLRADAGERFERVIATTQMKTSLLNRVASSVGNSASEKLRLMANRLNDCPASEHPWFGVIHSAATEALYCCRLSRLRSECEKELEETKEKLLDCVQLSEENKELKARLSNLEERRASARGEKRSAGCQTEAVLPRDTEEGETPEVETVEDPLPRVEEVSQENVEEGDESHQEVSALRRRVKEAEQLLSVAVEEMTEEHDGKMSRVQMQHEMEMEKLKATCQRGFVSVDESHLKVVEELQRRHRQEVERLLVERDQLLEEESAATATAIEAITNAHRLELQREEQRRRCQSEEYSNGNTVLDDVHREEMESFQRELEVLSQQFCLKCLENGHLLQALDAERKALGQCQQENQELRTRNQELSVHLAAEITRLCSLAKQSELPLGRQMDVYEMEITLRVKESEVQCLKQEITSLKDELQAAQRDKRNATKMYKDVYTELSIVRAKTSRDVDELRENLRLAHRALDQMSP